MRSYRDTFPTSSASVLAMFALIGFLAFVLAWLYHSPEFIAEPLHRVVASRLARMGWKGKDGPLRARRGAGIFRLLYQLQDCPFCMSTHIAFWATWYALDIHPWHRSFWLTWWAAVGIAWLALNIHAYHDLMVDRLGADKEATEDAG